MTCARSISAPIPTDQIDIDGQWKVRLGVRKDYWDEVLTPQAFVPGRIGPNGLPLEPGMTDTEIDTPTSWSVGTLYQNSARRGAVCRRVEELLDQFQLEIDPERRVRTGVGLEYEAGVEAVDLDGKFALTAAVFEISARQRVHRKHHDRYDRLQCTKELRLRCRSASADNAAMEGDRQHDFTNGKADRRTA